MNAQLTEIMRLITNLIRTGVVTEVDRENWLCRVKTGELETNWISWLTLRAGNARTWWRPSEGEQVVLLSLGGNLETAFALTEVCRVLAISASLVEMEATVSPEISASAVKAEHRTGVAVDAQALAVALEAGHLVQAEVVHTMQVIAEPV